MNEPIENYPQLDPAWDYYLHWHKLCRAKSKLEKLMKFISERENATDESDKGLENDLVEILNLLETARDYSITPDEPN